MAELGADARLLAGGQSLIPLMKLRLASPAHLVDLNFIPGLSTLAEDGDQLQIGPLVRHADIESSPVARRIPVLVDCAAGIADVQVRNMGTLAGSLAEADPSGDWAPVLLTLDTRVTAVKDSSERSIDLADLVVDAYTTSLAPDEVISEVQIRQPGPGSGGAYLAYKRCAQVYATASSAVALTMREGICTGAAVALGSVGLHPRRIASAEAELEGRAVDAAAIRRAAEAAREACDPQADMRGSVDFKRNLVAHLVEEATLLALRRSRGEKVEVEHIYG